ncbi:hypothetical protein BC826DRAFT_1012349 [Russula brevipes]|nr:hypothetical protein BC826DRAFT_1012349 [Russula brevipes]
MAKGITCGTLTLTKGSSFESSQLDTAGGATDEDKQPVDPVRTGYRKHRSGSGGRDITCAEPAMSYFFPEKEFFFQQYSSQSEFGGFVTPLPRGEGRSADIDGLCDATNHQPSNRTTDRDLISGNRMSFFFWCAFDYRESRERGGSSEEREGEIEEIEPRWLGTKADVQKIWGLIVM